MKGKKMTYVLLGGVVIIWGLIFMRIYSSLFSNSDEPVFAKAAMRKSQDYTEKDTFELIAKYRDPFLGGMQSIERPRVFQASAGAPARPKPISKPKEPEVFIDWSIINYIGQIKNPGSKRSLSLMLIKGSEYLMEEGNTKEDVTLIKNYKDSVKVAYSGKEKFIKRN